MLNVTYKVKFGSPSVHWVGEKAHYFVMLPSGTVAGGTAASRLNFCYTVSFGGILASQVVVNLSVHFRRWCFKQFSERTYSSFSIIPIYVRA